MEARGVRAVQSTTVLSIRWQLGPFCGPADLLDVRHAGTAAVACAGGGELELRRVSWEGKRGDG